MQCVSRRLLWCPVTWLFCDRGAALVTAGDTHRLPALRGSNQRAAAPATLFRPPGHPCRKGSLTFGLIPFRILWIASAVGCQSTHARLRSSSRGGQRSWSPRPQKGNRPPCLQKFLDLDPSRATPSSLEQVFLPETVKGKRPPRLQKQLQNWTTRGQPVTQESRSLRLVKKKLNYPSRHALRNMRMKFNGIRDIKDNQSPCLRESDDLDTRRQPANLSTPAQL